MGRNKYGEYICSLCSKGRRHKAQPFQKGSSKAVYLPSMLYHLTRKQKRQILQRFPFVSTNGGLKAHSHCVTIFRTFARHNQFFTPFVTCAICSEDIKDNEEALVPPCNIIAHSLHKDCLTSITFLESH